MYTCRNLLIHNDSVSVWSNRCDICEAIEKGGGRKGEREGGRREEGGGREG